MVDETGKNDPLMLAALLDDHPSTAGAWSSDDLAAMLRHELAQPASPGPAAPAAVGLAAQSVGELLLDPHAPPGVLARVRDAQRRRRHDPAVAVPPEVPTTLYYAAMAAGRANGGHPSRDTGLNESDWRGALGWLLAQRWLEEPLRGLFRGALGQDVEAPASAGRLPDVPPGPATPTAAGSTGPPGRASALPDRIGSYTLGEPLGEGGMGVVYLAEQDDPRRTVAIKVIRPSLLTRRALRRFGHEAEILGRLEHPNIARIYEAGTSGPRPFFAMELVRGTPVTQYAVSQKLTVRQRLELMAKVCDAVSYAHQRGVVHRDLKPANILVDEAGEPKVLDFGVARLAGDEPAALSLDTAPGHLVGTLQYMAPEQAAGDGRDVDTRADVYGLGAILYEVLAGQPAYDVRGRSVSDGLRLLRDTNPVPLARVSRWFRGDLSTIVAKSMAKEPARRYAGASHLASDLHRYLDHQPIAARPAGAAYTLRKFARRHRTLVFAAFAVVACLIAGVIGTASQARRAIAAEREVREKLRDSLLNQARAERFSGQPGSRFRAIQSLTEAALIRPGSDLRDEAIAALPIVDAVRLADLASLADIDTAPSTVAFDPSLEYYTFAAREGGDLDVRRTSDGSLVRRLATPGPEAWVVAFNRDATRLAVKYHPAAYNDPCWLRVWDLQTGRTIVDLPEMHGDAPFDFSPDGALFAVVAPDGAVALHDARRGREERRLPANTPAFCVRFSPDGRAIATGGIDTIQVRDVASGTLLLTLPSPSRVRSVAWHPTGRMLAATSDEILIRTWEFPSGAPRAAMSGHTNVPTDLQFDRTGRLLASYGWDRQLRFWDPPSGRQLLTVSNVQMFGDGVIKFGPAGDRLAYGARVNRFGLYALASGNERLTLPVPDGALLSAAVSTDNRWVALSTHAGVSIFDRQRNIEAARLPVNRQSLVAFDFAGSLVTWGDGGLRRWPFTVLGDGSGVDVGLPSVSRLPAPRLGGGGSLSHDGTLVALADYAEASVYLYDLQHDRLAFTGQFPNAAFAAVSVDGSLLAATTLVSPNPTVRVWHVPSEKAAYERPFPNRSHLMFSPTGDCLAVGSSEWQLVIRPGSWKVERVAALATSGGMAFHPNGTLVAFPTEDGLIGLVSPAGDKVFATMPGGRPVCFSRDGSLLLTHDGDLHVWDLRLIGKGLAEMGLSLDIPEIAARTWPQ